MPRVRSKFVALLLLGDYAERTLPSGPEDEPREGTQRDYEEQRSGLLVIQSWPTNRGSNALGIGISNHSATTEIGCTGSPSCQRAGASCGNSTRDSGTSLPRSGRMGGTQSTARQDSGGDPRMEHKACAIGL